LKNQHYKLKFRGLFTSVLLSIFIISVNGQDSLSIRKNAFYLGDEKISLEDTKQLIEENSNAYHLFSKGVSQRATSKVLSFAGGFLIGWPIGQAIRGAGSDPNWIMAFVGLFGASFGLILDTSSKKNFNRAVDFYNGSSIDLGIEKRDHFNMSIGLVESGFGINISF